MSVDPGVNSMARILIIDDELNILNVISTLMELEGHETVTVLGGERAKDLIVGEEFDLMITDIRMTPVNGMELLRLAHEHRPNMQVIMLTAYGQVETAVEAMELGAFDYVNKPMRADDLVDVVNRALAFGQLDADTDETDAPA
ncbi:MAG: response regulator [Lentisphaerales bacterium]|jgi:DNA-binding NtrC family response regulator|nr:MAG: response regulator [Lentisphaerales bacterium]